jgi:vitamin-K-epoxide reductase (warfarin-sensitive)
MTPRARWILPGIALAAVAGLAVSSLSLVDHYGREQTSYCDLSASLNCDIVNRSIYSSVMGIPVALIGILGYLGLLSLATVYRSQAETPVMLLTGSVAGLGFALYLTYIEKFVLATWCILCLSSLAAISAIAILSGALVVADRRRS